MTDAALGYEEARFGAGGREPYERVLRRSSGRLHLRGAHDGGRRELDVLRFLTGPTRAERRLLSYLDGPLIDLGCGPGRMLQAAKQVGLHAVGVDISAASVEIARERGLDAVHRSVFDPLPAEGEWGAALLIDGNIGIGGDPARLLSRCVSLIKPGGSVLVEVHRDLRRDSRFTAVLVDEQDDASLPFPWAEVGLRPLRSYAQRSGLRLAGEHRIDRRVIARLSV